MKIHRFGYIYVLTCLITMDEYVGQAQCWKVRWKGHCKACKAGVPKPLYNAMRKYGIENFAITIVRRCTLEDLNYWEDYYVEKFCTLCPGGYNLTEGGDGVRGLVFSPESRKRMSRKAAARPSSQRKTHGEFVRDWWAQPKTRRKMKKSLAIAGVKRRGLKRDPVAVEAGASKNRGRKQTPETCALQSKKAKKRNSDPAYRANISVKLKAYFADPANREKNRQAQLRGANCTAERRADASAKTKAYFASPANREKHRQNQLKFLHQT